MATKKMHLAAFYIPPGLHAAGWRLPEAMPDDGLSGYNQYIHVAQAAERGKMDFLLFQDGAEGAEAIRARGALAEEDAFGARLEPFQLLPALSMVTDHLGLVATASTTYNHPYQVARRFATLDHLSGGRGGWNLVTSEVGNEAWNFNPQSGVEPVHRYERAAEFCDICVGLWDSWEEGALLRDRESGQYYDPTKVHALNHVGRFFKVRGPLSVERCPQGRPLITAADSSEAGRELAARTADVVYTTQHSLAQAQAFYRDLKGRLGTYGRRADELKIMPGLMPIIGRTNEEAKSRYERLQSYLSDDTALAALNRHFGDLELGDYPIDGPLPELSSSAPGTTSQAILIELARNQHLSIRELGRRFAEGFGHRVVHGSPGTLADTMQEWIEHEAADGFTILVPYFPGGIDDFVGLVIPELQRRGLFRREYEGKMLRENLGLPFPASRYAPAKKVVG
jgi:FMN-dependent oxidoreductase (nitrilotriacetate monooxygenase family)